MFCPNCGTENYDVATYCKQCGKPFNRQKVCPACGRVISRDDVFCIYCGTRVAYQQAGEVLERSETVEKSGWTWRKIVELLGGIFAVAGVFSALLCTFLLGFKLSGDIAGSSANSLGLSGATQDIYYFFGKSYEDLEKIITALRYTNALVDASLYIPVVMSTVITAGTLVSVLVLAVLTAVRFGLKTAGKSQKDYSVYAIACIMTSILGSLLLLAVNAAFLNTSTVSSSTVSASSLRVALNGAGVAGIACGLVCLGAFLACRVAMSEKELLTKQSVLRLCFSTGALVLLGVLIGFAGKPGCVLSGTTSSSSSVVTSDCGLNLFAWGSSFVVSGPSPYSQKPVEEYVLTFFAGAVQIALVILTALAIISRLRHMIEANKKSGLALAIPLLACAAAYLVLDILSIHFGNEHLYRGKTPENTASYLFAIVTLVIAVLNFAASIVYKVLSRRMHAV